MQASDFLIGMCQTIRNRTRSSIHGGKSTRCVEVSVINIRRSVLNNATDDDDDCFFKDIIAIKEPFLPPSDEYLRRHAFTTQIIKINCCFVCDELSTICFFSSLPVKFLECWKNHGKLYEYLSSQSSYLA